MAQPHHPATPTVLLLARGGAWPDVVRRALGQALGPGAGGVCHLAASAEDAVARLVGPGHPYTHVLVEPESAAGRMADLIGLLFEEPESGARLVLLGDRAGSPPGLAWVRESRADAVAAVLAPRDRTPEGQRADQGAGGPAPPVAFTDTELRAALARGDVEARFQPIVRVSDRAPIGLEVLARLHDPARGTFAPERFVPQAERAGLSRQLTSAVMATAFGALPAALLREHGLFLAVNLPLDVLLVPEALAGLERQRSTAGFVPSDVLIELTESRPVCDLPGLEAAMGRWRAAGYRLAVDDVGPDMPHHRALLGLPFDAMKFAMEVVSGSAESERTRAYLADTAALAKRGGLAVIAEGVEGREDWDRVAALGADAVQGFMVARPLPAGAVPVWLRRWGGRGNPRRP